MNNSMSFRSQKVAVTFLLAALSGVAFAQGSGSIEERLRACDAIANPSDKLACFNSVVAGLEAGEEPDASPVAPASPAALPVVPAAKAEPVPQPPVEVQPQPVVESASAPENFGLKKSQIKKEKPQQEAVLGTVVRVWEHHDRRFTVELDNGQRWRETEGTKIGFPKEGDAVTITAGSFGGFRAKFDSRTRTAWVRRTR